MKLIKKLLLPFFPDSKYLRTKWWHRLTKVLTVAWTGIAVLIIVISLVFFPYQRVIDYIKAPNKVYKITDSKTNNYTYMEASELGKLVKQKYPKFNKYRDEIAGMVIFDTDYKTEAESILDSIFNQGNYSHFKPDTKNDIKNQLLLNFVLPIGALISIVIPIIVYRVFLYIVLGNIWRPEKNT